MSLEKAIADNTVALLALTAQLAAGGTTSAAAGKAPAKEKPAATETKATPKNDRAKVNAILGEVKEKKGTPAAKALIKDVGGVDKMADIPEDKFDAVFDAATKQLAAEAEEM